MSSFSPREVLDEILDLIESVSEGFWGFPTYSFLPTLTLSPGHAMLNVAECIRQNTSVTMNKLSFLKSLKGRIGNRSQTSVFQWCAAK